MHNHFIWYKFSISKKKFNVQSCFNNLIIYNTCVYSLLLILSLRSFFAFDLVSWPWWFSPDKIKSKHVLYICMNNVPVMFLLFLVLPNCRHTLVLRKSINFNTFVSTTLLKNSNNHKHYIKYDLKHF